MKINRNQWEGPFRIIKLKPHNTVKINTALKTNILVHVKNLKPYLGQTNKKFSSHFQKQGGDTNENFDYSDNKEDTDEKYPAL